MKPVRYHPEARMEAIESSLFYDSRQRGLGDRFLSALEQSERLVQSLPASGTPAEMVTRKHRMNKFPFAIIYKEYPDHIFIVAIAHFSRKPGYWKERA